MNPRLFLLLVSLCWSANTLAAEVGRGLLASKGLQFIVRTEAEQDVKKDSQTEAATIPNNRVCTLNIELASLNNDSSLPKDTQLTLFDARMPEHNHGMIVKPQIIKVDNTHWMVKGFKLHMKGLWRFNLQAKLDGADAKASFDVTI